MNNKNNNQINQKSSKERRLQTGLMGYYIPHKMWVALGAFLFLIFWMRQDLYMRFMSHASLNGLILGTAIIVVFMAFANAFKVQAAARILKRVENFEDNPDVAAQENILKDLRTKGGYVNTFYLQQAINNYEIGKDSFIKFDDNKARLIKGKVGKRSIHMRTTVQYLAGVLVMLGLIGTFWGLLSTITAVGEAMGSLSQGFDTPDGMQNFLTAISKPLQGMGIAFSASLFGLSGSLLAGLLNSFCGKGMDKFLENLGVWIDTRIPNRQEKAKIDQAELIQQHNNTVVKALDEVLGTMGRQSQQMFTQLSGVMAEFSRFNEQQQESLKILTSESKVNVRLADSMQEAVFGLQNEAKTLRECFVNLPAIQQELANDIRRSTEVMLDGQSQASQHIQNANLQSVKTRSTLNELISAYASMVSLMEKLVQHGQVEQVDDSASKVVLEMQQVLTKQLEATNWSQNPLSNRMAG